MKNFIRYIRSDRLTFNGFMLSGAFSFVTLLYILLNYNNLPPFIPVFNQLPWGKERLVSTPGIFIPIVLFAFLFLFNIIFTSVIYSKNPLIARIVASVTLLLAVVNFLFIIRTILLIT